MVGERPSRLEPDVLIGLGSESYKAFARKSHDFCYKNRSPMGTSGPTPTILPGLRLPVTITLLGERAWNDGRFSPPPRSQRQLRRSVGPQPPHRPAG